MTKKCTNVIVGWLIRCDAIEEKDRELYQYAVYSVLLSTYPLLFATCFGVVMGEVERSIAIIIPFAVIRKFSGGYHTKNSWNCFLWSSLLLLLCIGLSIYARCGWFVTIVTVMAEISLIYFSPIDNENRKLSQEENKEYKKKTAIWTSFFFMVALVFYLVKWEKYSVCIFIGIILSAGLQIPCIIKGRIKQKD